MGVEAGGDEALETGRHAARFVGGTPGILHGSRSLLLQDADGQVIEAHSASAGLDYPGIGPQLAALAEAGRMEVGTATDREAIAAMKTMTRLEGILPALAFLVAGDQDLAATERLLVALARAGADVVELGVPFSDPIADGPVDPVRRRRRVAGRGRHALARILELVAATLPRARPGVPLVLFTYVNPVLAHGLARFAEQAAASGVDGVL